MRCCSSPMSEAATPPTPDRAAVREALVLMLSATPYRLLDPLADALGHKGTFPERVADALLGPAPLPADVQVAVEKIRLNLDNEATYRYACSSGIAPLYLEHADGNQGFICSESDLRILLAHLTREAQ